MTTRKTSSKTTLKSTRPKAAGESSVSARLLALAEPTKALNARLPASVIERMENYLKATPGGLVHGSKTALVQGVLVNFLDQQGF
ncbi:MAG: hypothetical protein CTY12_02095 [Methylotenera sp.]|nr:MAG: hypothetical protein CTY12_02095 [Methylotenera sp.]